MPYDWDTVESHQPLIRAGCSNMGSGFIDSVANVRGLEISRGKNRSYNVASEQMDGTIYEIFASETKISGEHSLTRHVQK
jgi:hypothetical protein